MWVPGAKTKSMTGAIGTQRLPARCGVRGWSVARSHV
jgi:hypothetical protein